MNEIWSIYVRISKEQMKHLESKVLPHVATPTDYCAHPALIRILFQTCKTASRFKSAPWCPWRRTSRRAGHHQLSTFWRPRPVLLWLGLPCILGREKHREKRPGIEMLQRISITIEKLWDLQSVSIWYCVCNQHQTPKKRSTNIESQPLMHRNHRTCVVMAPMI